jgi:hypothetical protein
MYVATNFINVARASEGKDIDVYFVTDLLR